MMYLYPDQAPQRIQDKLDWLLKKPVATVKKDMVKKWKELWLIKVQGGEVSASKLLFYHTHVASADIKPKYGWFAPARHLHVLMSNDVHTILARMRVGKHEFLIEQRRWVKPSCQDSFDCTCRLCSLRSIEDEAHVLLHCPFYETIRMEDKFSDLFSAGQLGLRDMFASQYQIVLAKFIAALIQCRTDSL